MKKTKICVTENCGKKHYAKGLCASCYGHEYNLINAESRKTYNKKYREIHKEEIAVLQKIWVENNKEKVIADRKKYREKNKETVVAREKAYKKNNKDKIADNSKRYYDDNRDKILIKSKIYRENNKEKTMETRRKYRNKKRKTDIIFKLREGISGEINRQLGKNKSSKKGKSMLEFLPCTIQQFKDNLESKFDWWMTWDNRGIYNPKTWDDKDPSTWTWTIDHIIPQSDLPYTSMEDDNFKQCWALENIRPYSAKLNCIDGANRTRHKK